MAPAIGDLGWSEARRRSVRQGLVGMRRDGGWLGQRPKIFPSPARHRSSQLTPARPRRGTRRNVQCIPPPPRARPAPASPVSPSLPRTTAGLCPYTPGKCVEKCSRLCGNVTAGWKPSVPIHFRGQHSCKLSQGK